MSVPLLRPNPRRLRLGTLPRLHPLSSYAVAVAKALAKVTYGRRYWNVRACDFILYVRPEERASAELPGSGSMAGTT